MILFIKSSTRTKGDFALAAPLPPPIYDPTWICTLRPLFHGWAVRSFRGATFFLALRSYFFLRRTLYRRDEVPNGKATHIAAGRPRWNCVHAPADGCKRLERKAKWLVRSYIGCCATSLHGLFTPLRGNILSECTQASTWLQHTRAQTDLAERASSSFPYIRDAISCYELELHPTVKLALTRFCSIFHDV